MRFENKRAPKKKKKKNVFYKLESLFLFLFFFITYFPLHFKDYF